MGQRFSELPRFHFTGCGILEKEMADVEHMPADAPALKGDFVEIVCVNDMFLADGSVAYENPAHAVFFNPPPFENLEAAVNASKEWADSHGIPKIYVRELKR